MERWSGGGSALALNVQCAVRGLAAGHPARRTSLVQRNAAPTSRLVAGDFCYLPQNAWAWHGPARGAKEAARRTGLRLTSEVALRRCRALIRLSPAIPDNDSVPSIVLANVLDDGFERAVEGLGSEPPEIEAIFLLPGALTSYKNQLRALAAFRRYRRQGGGYRLRILGEEFASSYRRLLEAEVAATEGSEIIVGSWSRPEILRTCRRAGAVLLPSLVEASPFSILEAQALGSIVVASDIAGHRATVRSYTNTSLVDPWSETDLANAMAWAEHAERERHPLEDPTIRSSERQRWTEAFTTFLASVA